MADITLKKSIGELIDEKALAKSLTWTAGQTTDSATWTGISIDRESFATGSLPMTMDAAVFYDATLASGHTLSLYWDVKEGPDGSNWSDYATEAATVVATGVSGGAAQQGIARLVVADSNKPTGTPGINLGSARRYIRLDLVPHLSATGTDTAIIAAVGVFAGFDALPSPQT